MIPLRDENPTEIVPFVTAALIGLNVVAWLVVQGMGEPRPFLQSICGYGMIPGELTGAFPEGARMPLGEGQACVAGGLRWTTLLTSMFMHGSWLHLIGNMWFLWVFGNNIEDSMGHLRFVVFYLLIGALAAGTHLAVGPSSGIPTVGASGAISGVMGAYLLLYPRVRVHTLFIIFIFIRIFPVPAWVWLGYWFVLQLLMGSAATGTEVGGGVAFWAHIGGFVAGLVLIRFFERDPLVEAKRSGRRLSREEVRDLGWF